MKEAELAMLRRLGTQKKASSSRNRDTYHALGRNEEALRMRHQHSPTCELNGEEHRSSTKPTTARCPLIVYSARAKSLLRDDSRGATRSR